MASSAAVRALGLVTDPRVSEVVDQLAELQASGRPVAESDVLVRYAALSAAVVNVDPSPDSKIGDLTVRQLRSRFGADKRMAGLILVDETWLPPKKVLRGRPIFGKRRAFVPDRSHSDRLWRVLGVSTPGIGDCLEVLGEVARGTPSAQDEQVCPCSTEAGGGGADEQDGGRNPESCTKPRRIQRLVFSKSEYPNIRRHFRGALRRGWPRRLIVNRPRADARRDRLLEDIPTRDGYDRDEYPPAVGRGKGKGLERGRNPRGWKADVRYVPSSENRSHGASLGSKLADFCNGTRFRYVFR